MKKPDDDQPGDGEDSPEWDRPSADRDFTAALLASAKLDVPPSNLEARVMQGLDRRPVVKRSPRTAGIRRAALAAAAIALAAAVALLVRRRGSTNPDPQITAEPPPTSSSLPVRACAHPLRAAGLAPMIDDFEDGDGAIRPLEGRVGKWYVARDSDPQGTSQTILPTLRPEPTANNRFALHSQAGELRDWGASIEVTFEPPCYDASVYAGIGFSARGPGRLYLAAREARVVGVEYGGTCTHDCYNAHVRKIDVGAEWQHFDVHWSDLRQRGYQTLPLDPQNLHSLTFQVHADDTPYDLWIDDVAFLTQ